MWTKVAIALLTSGAVLTGQAAQAHDHDGRGNDRYEHDRSWDYARVIDVQPLVRQIRVSVPRRECYQERYDDRGYDQGGYSVNNDGDRYLGGYGPRRSTAGSMILGGIVGAAIGNSIGSGDGRRAATVAGAIIGSAIGHDAGERRAARDGGDYDGNNYDTRDRGYRDSRSYPVERCQTRYEDRYENRIDGYRVTYEYHGRRGVTQLAYDPGDRIRIPSERRCDNDRHDDD